MMQMQKKSEEVLLLRQENFVLASNQSKNKIEMVEMGNMGNTERRERVRSGDYRNVMPQREKDRESVGKLMAMERELDAVVREFKA